MNVTPVGRAWGTGWEKRPYPSRDFRATPAKSGKPDTAPSTATEGRGTLVDRIC